jgi:hypothetical protein
MRESSVLDKLRRRSESARFRPLRYSCRPIGEAFAAIQPSKVRLDCADRNAKADGDLFVAQARAGQRYYLRLAAAPTERPIDDVDFHSGRSLWASSFSAIGRSTESRTSSFLGELYCTPMDYLDAHAPTQRSVIGCATRACFGCARRAHPRCARPCGDVWQCRRSSCLLR